MVQNFYCSPSVRYPTIKESLPWTHPSLFKVKPLHLIYRSTLASTDGPASQTQIVHAPIRQGSTRPATGRRKEGKNGRISLLFQIR